MRSWPPSLIGPVRVPDAAGRPPLVSAARDADLTGRHIVVTAGGTREAIDPVRFIGNRSTGRMGVAVAEAALARGAAVTVIAANVEVPLPGAATVIQVESTADLRSALLRVTHRPDGSAGFDALVMAAAVADFRPVAPAARKLERASRLAIELEATPDLLAEIGRISPWPRQRRRADADAVAAHADPGRFRGRDRLAGASRRQAPPQGRGPAGRQRRERARIGLRHRRPIESRSWRPTGPATSCRSSPSGRSPNACSTAWRRALDERDAARQTDATTEPSREPA